MRSHKSSKTVSYRIRKAKSQTRALQNAVKVFATRLKDINSNTDPLFTVNLVRTGLSTPFAD